MRAEREPPGPAPRPRPVGREPRINRLPEALGDELLVRDGHHLRPTGRGEALAETLPRALDLLRRSKPFVPATCERTFRLDAPDFLGGVLPDLLAEVAAAAPQARVKLPAVSPGALRDVAEWRFDLLVAPPLSADWSPVRHELVGASDWGVFGRRDHPAFAGWSAEASARWPHLQISTGSGEPGPIDRAATAAGLSRTVGAVVSLFAMAPALLARTGLLLTVPRVALHAVVAPHGLEERLVPFEVPAMPLALYWSAVLGDEGAVSWFRRRVAEVLQRTVDQAPLPVLADRSTPPPVEHSAHRGPTPCRLAAPGSRRCPLAKPEPLVWSVGGTGTALRACTRHDEAGIFDATRWVTLLYLPLLPLDRARYRLIERRSSFPGQRRLLLQRVEELGLGPVGVVRTYLLAWVVLPLALVLPTGLLGLPGILAGRFDLAAAGAVLSAFWMIPFGIGALLWTQGQPWPQHPPRASAAALVRELGRGAPRVGVAVAATFLILGGSCGGLRVVVDWVGGLGLRQALLGGVENAAFFLVLCALVGPVLWIVQAWRAAQG